MKMRKIEYVVSNERLITPSGLSLVGQVLGKSNLRNQDFYESGTGRFRFTCPKCSRLCHICYRENASLRCQ